MNETPHPATERASQIPRHRNRWRALAICVSVAFVFAGAAARWIRRRAEPEARRLVVQTLSNHLHCKVELDTLQVSVFPGFPGLRVSGRGLRIQSIDGRAHLAQAGIPMLTAESFQFQTTIGTLLRHIPGVVTVYVQNVIVTIPPASDSTALPQPKAPSIPGALLLQRVVVDGARLVLETGRDDKPPLEFDMRAVTLDDLGAGKAFAYAGTLVNAPPMGAPMGNVDASGHLGPWNSASPRETPVDGQFHLTHADLTSIGGLNGTATGAGSFDGTLASMEVQGSFDVPDFALATSAHPVALRTDFHVLLDNGTGDLTIQSKVIKFLNTTITATGSLVASTGGHAAEIDVEVQGRNEDLLALLSKAKPPVLNGALSFQGHLSTPASANNVVADSRLQGVSTVHGATWGTPQLQQMVDDLSERAQGNAKLAKADPKGLPVAPSSMTTRVAVDKGTMTLSGLVYTMPGASVVMQGSYPLLGTQIDLHGVVRTAAHASQMTTGWKSLLLKPVDPLMRGHGAGTEIPVKLTGDLSHPVLGTDFKNRGEDKAEAAKTVTVQRK